MFATTRLLVIYSLGMMLLPGLALADTLIHAGRLIDGNQTRPRTEVTIRISGDTITAIETGYSQPTASDQTIDLRSKTVLPGLMDMHTHLSSSYSKNSYIRQFTLNPADYALMAAKNARLTLMAGFTTIRDLGDAHNVSIALRDAINKGDHLGPRIYTAGTSLATTGGHADPSNGWAEHLAGNPGPKEGVINSVADARKAVRQRYKEGADWIKITATGGVLSLAKNGQNPQFYTDELEAIVETARDYGMQVAAHAHGSEGMQRAIEAGVKSIEHGTYMTDDIMRLMKKNKTWYVPTILAGEWVSVKSKEDGFFPEVVRPKAAAIGPLIKDTFSRAHKAGVNIVFGTDTGVSAHGDNAQEFALMVAGGMSEAEAIQAATSVAASFLGIEAELGSVESGKLADLIAVEDDPYENITTLERVVFVMKNGVIIKQ